MTRLPHSRSRFAPVATVTCMSAAPDGAFNLLYAARWAAPSCCASKDTDKERRTSTAYSTRSFILEGAKWLGVDWAIRARTFRALRAPVTWPT